MEKTRKVLNNAFIADVLLEFGALQAKETDTDSLEKQWQAFLKNIVGYSRRYLRIQSSCVAFLSPE